MVQRDDALLAVAEQWDRTPWTPPGLTFEVGSRVRIRLSAECRKDWEYDGDHPKVIGHPAEFEGAPGRIDVIRPASGRNGDHPYGVRFDAEIVCPVCPEPATGGWFAASELQPLTTEAP